MSKKILSLSLALCLLLLSLPVFTLPLLAEETGEGDPTVYTSIASVDGKIVEESAVRADAVFANGNTIMTWNQYKAENSDKTLADYAAYFKTQGKFSYEGPWASGIINTKTGAFEPITRWYPFAGMKMDDSFSTGVSTGGAEKGNWDVQWATTEAAFMAGVDLFIKGEVANVWTCNGGVMMISSGMGVAQPSEGTIFTVAYTAPKAGTVKLSYSDAALCDGALLSIAIDGNVVWPVDATLSNTGTWYKATAETTAASLNALLDAALADGVKVPTGGKVEFCVAKTKWLSAPPYNGVMIDPAISLTPSNIPQYTVTYTDANGLPIVRLFVDEGAPLPANPNTSLALGYDIDGDGLADTLPLTVTENITLVPIGDLSLADEFSKNVPVITPEGTTTGQNGNWSVIHGHWSDNTESAENATWTYEDTGIMHVVTNLGEKIIISSEAVLWAEDGGGLDCDSLKMTVCSTASLVGNAAVYTAPATGVLQLDFAKLISGHQVNATTPAGVASTYLAITQNGKIVWPSNGKPYHYVGTTEYAVGQSATEDFLEIARAYEAFPSLMVCEGDEIAFIGNMGNDTTWMFTMAPTVHYTARLEDPAVETVSAILGDTFSLKFKVSADELASGVGLLYKGQMLEADADGYVTITGIAAKAMTDEIVIQPCAVIGESNLAGAAETYTFAAVVKAVIDSDTATGAEKNLAKATLYYGAAAQVYLNYYPTRLPNEGVEAPTAASDITNVYALSNTLGEDAEAFITGASVLMKDDLSLKIVCRADASFRLQISEKADFSDATEVSLAHCGLGSKANEYKAMIHNIKMADWNTTYYIRLVDADGVDMSEVLTYSVLSYTERVSGNTAVTNLMTAMQNLYSAAAVRDK